MCTDGRCCADCPLRRPVSAGPQLIAQTLPALGTVLAVTANGAALLSQSGTYWPGALPGEALRCGDDRVAVRLHPEHLTERYLTPKALTLGGESGTHRAYFTPSSDRLGIEALTLAPADETVPEPAETELSWREADHLSHLDTLTVGRYPVLRVIGARQVQPDALPLLLGYLARVGMQFTVAVPGGGCVQLLRGQAALVEPDGPRLSVMFGAAQYVMQPAAITECWVSTVHGSLGPTSVIELYDADRRCVSSFTQTGLTCPEVHAEWEAMVASLP